MKRTAFLKVTALLLALITALTLMTACEGNGNGNGSGGENGNGDGNTNTAPTYDLTGYTLVRCDDLSSKATEYFAKVKQALLDSVGVDLSVNIDVDFDETEKEILVGNTNRKESLETIKYLENKNEKESYAIRFYPNKIVITGTDDASTLRAMQVFVKEYVNVSQKGSGINISAGNQKLGIYDADSIVTLKNGTEISIDYVSPVIEVTQRYTLPDGTYFIPQSGSYPAITQLNYQSNEEYNGRLIAIYSGGATVDTTNGDGNVMMSDDDGLTWSCIARPREVLYPALSARASMAHVYELPAQVGDMPAGTLLYSYNSVNYDNNNNGINGKSILAVWRSLDGGYTWEEYVIIDEARGIKEGIWEPFMIYCEEDQYLYCFYSDDSDPDHDQKLSYKRSKDGVNWEGEGGKIGTGTGKDVEPVDVVAINDFSYRPGMAVITKMGNGEYFLVYEQFGDWSGCPIYYKKTKDLSDWGDPSDIGTRLKDPANTVNASAPCCAWLPVGGECGTLFVTSKASTNRGYIFVSTDYGETWETIEDPLESDPIKPDGGDRVGYSAGMWVGADNKTLYYINSDNSAKKKDTQVIYFVKMTLFEKIDD